MKGLDRHRVIGSIFLIFALVTYSQTVKLSYQVAIFLLLMFLIFASFRGTLASGGEKDD